MALAFMNKSVSEPRDLRDVALGESQSEPVNEEAVLTIIENIFNIRYMSCIFNRDIGSEIEDILFEPFLFSNSQRLEHIIRRSITMQCRCVKIQQLTIEMNHVRQSYDVTLVLDIDGIGIFRYSKSLQVY